MHSLRRRLLLFAFASLIFTSNLFALERQDSSTYHARRIALSKKTSGGAVVLFAPVERSDELYGFRQNDNFYYLTGWSEPGAALLISPEKPATAEAPARPYVEILFLPARNLMQEKSLEPNVGVQDP